MTPSCGCRDMEWINRWFMRQRAAERRRTAPPKPPKSVIDLTVKREQVDLQVDVCASGTTTTPTDVQLALPAKEEEEEAEDSSSTHIASSPTRYSMTSSLPPSSSPPSSPAPHTVKPSAPYHDAAAIPTLRLFRGLPYEDPRARHPNASDVQAPGEGASNLPAQTYTPASVPVSAYMRGVSAAIPVSATLSTSRPAASAHVFIAPKPTHQPLFNPYLPRGPTSRPLLPVSALPGPSSWDEYLSARARVVQQEHPATSGKADAVCL
ncbi:hypothetical protein OH76DRAFT_1228675 [Lentinus brumalis]|uniref:Uncharacterized protein n=1 Tax=Lentinus brumalis TaxID=2498619 RepID=A0A371DLZ1_9APHY|nr:hypothetical protein OH76DRAFT_1228675 [Polyporus brumalis]